MIDIKSAVIFDPDFFDGAENLFNDLRANVTWDDSMRARKTASFGQASLNSKQIDPLEPMSPVMQALSDRLAPVIGFEANNCFLNYYEDGHSKMGWHGDTTDFLEPDTGTAIVSVGDTRIFQLRRKAVQTELLNYVLIPGSLIYMPSSIQKDWQHAIPKVVSDRGRISLTFKKMKLSH